MSNAITALISSVIAALISGIIYLLGVKISSSYPLKIEETKQRYELLKYRRELILEAYFDYCDEKKKYEDDFRSSNVFELFLNNGDPGSQFYTLIANRFNLIEARCIRYLVAFTDEHASTIEAALSEVSDAYDKMFEARGSLSDSEEDMHRKASLIIQYITSINDFDKIYYEVLKDEMKFLKMK